MPAYSPSSIAIIGLSGRFPDAPDVPRFWRNLEQGLESLNSFSDSELREAGVPQSLLENPNYVKKGSFLEHADRFDASFFGYNPREAEILDPQQRIFLECAWEALEDSGYAGDVKPSAIGVFAGSTTSSYAYSNLLRNPAALQAAGGYQVMIANDKDYLATRVSYKLNFKGPSLTVQTACSTSLVAVQTACAALLNGQCDMALAGGVSIGFPQKGGYLYTDGMIFSPDGHCRPFDAQGRGIRAGFGAGVVVLKRLEEALRAGDTIHAIIRGIAVNNDGGLKMGYTAPSIEGQSAVISDALRFAQVDPASIGYIEAHGTATPLGDPIEIAALTRVFRASTAAKQFCAIGSVKSNIGHLDAAAGVAGLIKTVLALKHKRLPPSLNFREPNPQIDFENSPFFVNASLSEWISEGAPRRAGVSSFGIGGTNAHAVLEEAPPLAESKTNWPAQLLVLSAKTSSALESATANLAARLKADPLLSFPDVCYTSQVGRRRFPHRRAFVCADRADAIRLLSTPASQNAATRFEEAAARPVVFMFSGQGSQHIGMAHGLYRTQPVFRAALDECAALLHDELRCDLRDLLYAPSATAERLTETRFAQPALFSIEYCLARLWMSWGVIPESMIGHSIGEYVAACLAGVFSLEDALRLISVRGRLMQQMPAGAMLAVSLSPTEARSYINGDNRISLAAVNTPGLCAIAGPSAALGEFRRKLEASGIDCHPVHTSHAFHSSMMDGMLDQYRECVGKLSLSAPQIPFLSNLTGRWISATEAMDASYWTHHLRRTVCFADGIRELATEPNRVFLEVGPGQVLSTFARECLRGPKRDILASLPHPKDRQTTDAGCILNAVGRLWLSGVPIDWAGLHQGEVLHRVPLPTYPFERQSYWVAPDPTFQTSVEPAPAKHPQKADFDDWFYVPSWRRTLLPSAAAPAVGHGPWLLFLNDSPLCASLEAILRERGESVATVRSGDAFLRIGDREYTVDPSRFEDYVRLLRELESAGLSPRSVLYLWSFDTKKTGRGSGIFHSLRLLGQVLGERPSNAPVDLLIVSSGMHTVVGGETVDPHISLALGPSKVIPREYPHIHCRSIDLLPEDRSSSVIEDLLLEPGMPHPARLVAYRTGYRWEQCFDRLPLPAGPETKLRDRGVYLITGGFGGIGLTLAAYLAETAHARLALVSRTPVPDELLWSQWLETHGPNDETSRLVAELKKLQALGAEVLPLSADVCDPRAMHEVVDTVHRRFGPINGVIHAAGLIDPALISRKTQIAADRVLAPKVTGTLVLDPLLKSEPLDFLLLCSSISAICNYAGAVDYSAANCFLDAFAAARSGASLPVVISVNWDSWGDVGMAVKALRRNQASTAQNRGLEEIAISPAEGVKAFRRVLACGLPQVAVITRDLHALLDQAENVLDPSVSSDNSAPAARPASLAAAQHRRPELASSYAPPATDTERSLTEIWSELLGIGDIGVDDNFFELGGHSLLATGVLSRVRNNFGVTVPLRAIFDAPTIRSLSEHVETLLWAASSRSSMAVAKSEEREEIEL